MFVETDETAEIHSLMKVLGDKIDFVRTDAQTLKEIADRLYGVSNTFSQLVMSLKGKKITGRQFKDPKQDEVPKPSIFAQSLKITPKTAARGKKQWKEWELKLLRAWNAGSVRECDKGMDYLVRKFGRTEESIRHKLRNIRSENVGKD